MSGRLVAARNQSRLRHVFETPKKLNYEYHTHTQRQKVACLQQHKHIY